MTNKNICRFDIQVTMDNMRDLRLKAGLTQQQLGDVLNVPRSYICKWETGISKPEYENLVRLYRVLHGIVV